MVTKLDDICWALNLRGSDIQFNPVFFSFLVVTSQDTLLFSEQHQDPSLVQYCLSHSVQLFSYSSFYEHLATLPAQKVLLAST